MSTRYFALQVSMVEVNEHGRVIGQPLRTLVSDYASSDEMVVVIAQDKTMEQVSWSVFEAEGHMRGGETLVSFVEGEE